MTNPGRLRTAGALIRGAVMTAALLLLSGCQALPSLMSPGGEPMPRVRQGTLAAIPPMQPRLQGESAEPGTGLNRDISLESVMESYKALLPLIDDPQKQVIIRHRLADLEFQRAERKMADTAEDELAGAIEAYQRLLAEYPDRESNDQIYYQLARAWELKGATSQQLDALSTLVRRYPESAYWIEAQFRRADLLFIDGRYPEAEAAFDQVTLASQARNADASFLVNAHYMKGWSQFKQGDYPQALFSFVEVLDLVMPEGQPVDDIDQRNRTLIEDLFRVVGLSLSYLDGAETLQALFRQTGGRPYEILVYDRYAELLLEREQYTDAIEVFEAFIEDHLHSPWAPHYHLRIITTLELAGFIQTIPRRKAGFVEHYGIYSDYWQAASPDSMAFIEQQLEQLLPELADRHYLLAGNAADQPQADAHYRQAASYYAEFAATFPEHPRTPERLFLLGETYLALEDWPAAIGAFERVAYDYPGDTVPGRAAEAGYASVLAFRDYARTWPEEPLSELQAYREQQQLNRLRFANAFPDDPRATRVYYIALHREFQQRNWESAVAMAARLVAWQPAPPRDLMTETLLLSGHSLSELKRYAEAEQAYRDALVAMTDDDERRGNVRENLAASVYRQAEQLAEAGQVEAAISEYLRVGTAVPESTLRANAEYDAASLLITANLWARAIDVLTRFRGAFPDHKLIDTVPAKLALAYRETEQWERAGDELQRMVALASTPEERRENLLIAAELYDQAGNRRKAIETWRAYATRYPEPPAVYMEAANRLAELYQAEGEPEQRDDWLRQQMQTVDRQPDAADDRMRYLAASASARLARDALARYDSIRLTLPLNQSMTAKTDALEKAVTAYQKTANYGLSSFATEAGYQIAHIYGRLGADLMDSERPPGLSELELAQYELLLEEQAYPFEDNAIDIHEQNIRRAREGIFDDWVQRSYEALKQLLPGRYNKEEVTAEVVNELD
ncbi:MAG TPA: tetratricopeptide repeat protein [Marinobacter sp.]|uniref:tetratricopeptide repeat protein n=1 Tax=Marinobacter sp. TaxID=50741 RepID=UPI002D7EB3F2|nr:tetratricopeptide repeat protein [Marinobacter sp.]HET8800226.1 tetratricopeptide repeat protein [Marinobacter sp.]